MSCLAGSSDPWNNLTMNDLRARSLSACTQDGFGLSVRTCQWIHSLGTRCCHPIMEILASGSTAVSDQRRIASGERRILFSYGFMGHAQTFHNKAVSLVADQITAVPDRINGGTTGCGINPASERHGSSDALNPLLVLWITEAISVKAHCLRAAATERLGRCVSLQQDSDATQVSFLRC